MSSQNVIITGLERVLNPELHDAWNPGHVSGRAGQRLNPAEGAGIQVRTRIPPVDVIEQIERLDSKLKVLYTSERDNLRQRQVDVPVTGSPDAIPLVIAERAERRLRKRRPIEIAGQRLLAVYIVTHLVDPLLLEALSVERAIRTGRDVQPAARPRADDTRQPPARDKSAEYGIADVRRLVAEADVRHVGTIRTAVTPIHFRVRGISMVLRKLRESARRLVAEAPGPGVVPVERDSTRGSSTRRELQPAVVLVADARVEIHVSNQCSRRRVFSRERELAPLVEVLCRAAHGIGHTPDGARSCPQEDSRILLDLGPQTVRVAPQVADAHTPL